MDDKSQTRSQPEFMDDEIDLGELIGVLLDGKWRIVCATVVAAIFGICYAFYATPVYEADILLQVEDSAGSSPFDEIASFMGDEAASETEIEVIRSRSVAGRVVDKLQLQIIAVPRLSIIDRTQIALQPKIAVERLDVPSALLGKTFTLTILPEDRFELAFEQGFAKTGVIGEAMFVDDLGVGMFVSAVWHAPAGAKFEVTKLPRAVAVKQFQEKLSVSEKGKKTGVIRVSVQGADNQALKEQLNALGNIYVQQNVERKSEEAEKSLKFLDEQLPALRREVDAAELALNNYLSENKLVDLTAESQSVLGQLVAIEQGLSELNLKRAELEQEFNDQHPALVALTEQERQLHEQRKSMEAQIADLPDTQQAALRLKRDVEVNNVLYTFLLNKAQELRVIKAGTTGNVRVLDEAFLPYQPVKPKKALILALSLILGGMVGVAWVFVRRMLNRGVRSPDEVEQKLGLSVYATVPLSKAELDLFESRKRKKGARELLALSDPRDLAIEALRSLRTSLHFALMQADNNRVVITGPSPGIGKSFISTNLGCLLADIGKRVVVVDADMRKGHCHELFGSDRNNGLSEYVSQPSLELAQVIKQHPEINNFYLISTGEIPPNPSELLLNPRFGRLLDELSEQFDMVIIDTPPIMAVADAGIVLPHAAAAFVVARVGVNQIAEIEASVKRLTQDGGKISGVLLNGMVRTASNYGGYKYYQYDYK